MMFIQTCRLISKLMMVVVCKVMPHSTIGGYQRSLETLVTT